jgi:SPP1 family predicted phage head-tail adaptor
MVWSSTMGKTGRGVYRHYISITLNSVTSQGDRGQSVFTPTTIGSTFALLEPLSGRKLDLAKQVYAVATHEVRFPYMSGVTPECQVVYGTRTFNIGSVRNEQENNWEMVLLCEEVQ